MRKIFMFSKIATNELISKDFVLVFNGILLYLFGMRKCSCPFRVITRILAKNKY